MPARVAVLLLLVQAVPACTVRGAAQPAPAIADLLLTGAKVVTVDEGLPEAEAVAIRGDRILALGSAEQLQAHVGASTRVIALRGQLVIPGFTESHGHFSGLGEAELQLGLMGAESWEQILVRVAAAAKGAKPGEWIVGSGWHQEKWDAPPRPSVEGFPTHASLDAVSPDNPVLLTHASGHAVFVNARAMALSGITRATPSPPGGEILKDAAGEPTGLLRETAADLVRIEAADRARERKRLEIASAAALANGITPSTTPVLRSRR